MTQKQPLHDDSFGRVVIRALRELPPKAKRSLYLTTSAVVIALGIVAAAEWLDGKPLDLYSILTAFLAVSGMLLLGVIQILHKVSQQDTSICSRIGFFSMRSQNMDRVFLVFPVLGVISAVLIALAIGVAVTTINYDNAWKISLGVFMCLFFGSYMLAAVRVVAHTSRFLFRYAREQSEAAAQAREEAVEARMSALQSQMQPHFLFNALNTAASLVRTNGRSAETTIENLAQVLRRTLDRSQSTTGTLGEEIEYLTAYLSVEQERWGERLHVVWEIDPDTLNFPLPPLTLQPLVENALVHGIGSRLEGGTIRIRARRQDKHLVISICDDGPGFPTRYRERTGLGNLRKRLETIYGADATVRSERNGNDNGASVTLEIPVQSTAGVGP